MKRLLLGLMLVVAVAAMAAEPAHGCIMNAFLPEGLTADGKATVGQEVTFRVGFQDLEGRTGSVKLDFGDGTATDTGPRTIERKFFQSGAYISVGHIYTKPGTFYASLKGGTLENQPCTNSPTFGFGSLNPDGSPRHQVQVVANPAHAATKSADQVPALTRPEVKAKATVASALPPGKILRASVQGNLLTVEGSGKCALKMFEELDGRALRTYDFKGPLPTTIQLSSTLPGMHVLKIEGDKSSEGCSGTASASLSVPTAQTIPTTRSRGVLRP